MPDDLGLRNGRQHIDGGDSCRRRGRLPTASAECGVAITVVVVDVFVVGRGVDDYFVLVVAFDRPRRVEVVEGVEEGGDEMHRNRAQEDEKDIANQPRSSQARHPVLYPRCRAGEEKRRGWSVIRA